MGDLLDSAPSLDQTIDESRLVVWLRPEVAITRIEGSISLAVANALIDAVDGTLRRSKSFLGLHDWTMAPTFDVTVPARLAAWTLSHLPRVGRIVIATAHPLVTMAVRTANLTIRRIEHVPSREAWLEVVRRSL